MSYTVRRRVWRATRWTTAMRVREAERCDPADRSERTEEVIARKNVPRRRTTRSRIIFYEGIVSVLYIGSLTTRCSLVVAACRRRVPFLRPAFRSLSLAPRVTRRRSLLSRDLAKNPPFPSGVSVVRVELLLFVLFVGGFVQTVFSRPRLSSRHSSLSLSLTRFRPL